MKLKELSKEQTEIWLSNLDKLADLYNECQRHYRETIENRKQIANETVLKNGWSKFWSSLDEWDDIYHHWDGRFIRFGYFFSVNEIKELPRTSPEFVKIKDLVLDVWIRSGRKEKVSKLITKWGNYAEQPFQIDNNDLDDYLNVLKWHKELKELAEPEGIYDEAFNLDEDCV